MAEEHYGRNRTQKDRFAKKNTKRARSLDIKKLGLQGRGLTLSRKASEEVLNTEWNDDACMFLRVCDSFEKSLEDLNVTENFQEIYKKLLRIRNLINKKTSLGNMSKEKSSDSVSTNFGISDLSQSMQSLCSISSCKMDPNNDSDLYKYMNAVNCPFCSEIQSDEISFVKHLDKSCSSHQKKEFKKRDYFPYATFQILPNNTFKCNICVNATARNIQYFYLHMQSRAHLVDYTTASKTRKYENLVFCASCKVMVYNTYKQIKSHIDSENHLSKCSSKKTSEYFICKGIHCVLNEAKKFKCLDCPPVNAVYTSPQAILDHFNSPMHKKYKKKNVLYSSIIYCEVCSEEVHLMEIINHSNSDKHQENEKKLKERGLEVCFFCDFFCENLMELSCHMESECAKITAIRQKISEKKENIITSKKSTKMADSLKDGEFINGRNGIRLGNVGKSAKMDETESKSKASDSSSESEDDAMTIQDDHLDKLFARVSDHLMKTTQKLNTTQELKIQHDCIQTLRLENCHLVGFSGSGLSFPSESINLFCGPKADTSMTTEPENLLKASHIVLSDSKLWKNVQYFNDEGPFPCLKCVHKETQRSCTIIVNESSLEVTNMLRSPAGRTLVEKLPIFIRKGIRLSETDISFKMNLCFSKCMEKSELVKPFCLIIRFWLSVHELKIQKFEFALISLLVFFLVNANVVTLSEEECKDSVLTRFFQEKTEVQPSSQGAVPVTNVKELFQKFLRFLDLFNFDSYAIFLPLRDPIPKSLFNQGVLKNLPHINNLKDCSMCILDPNLSVNLAADIEWEDRKAFLKIVAATVKHYNIK